MLRSTGVPLSFGDVMGMALRRTLNRDLVSAIIVSHKSELDFTPSMLEAHHLARGRVQDVVMCAIALKNAGQTVPALSLLAEDLAHGRLRDLTASYIRAHQRHPQLQFAEFARRHIGGEDVIAAVSDGSFAPFAEMNGWTLRAEYGPGPGAHIKGLVAALPGNGRFFLRLPNQRDWQEIPPGRIPE